MRDWPGEYTVPIIIVVALLIVFLIIGQNMDFWKDLSEVVQGLGVGIGTFLAAFWARPLFGPIIKWWEQKVKEREMQEKEKEAFIEKYTQRFARLKRKKDLALIWKLKDSDKILAVYQPKKTWQHINSWGTYKKLGYESGDWDREVEKSELNGYKEDEPIDFS